MPRNFYTTVSYQCKHLLVGRRDPEEYLFIFYKMFFIKYWAGLRLQAKGSDKEQDLNKGSHQFATGVQ